MFYVVKTEAGYFYTTGRGRYGRIDGQRLYAAVLCEAHAKEQQESLQGLEVEAELEVVTGKVVCETCERAKT